MTLELTLEGHLNGFWNRHGGLASRLDGLMLTGGRANVEPHHYEGPPFPEDEVRDPPRDNTVLPLVRECVAQGVPVATNETASHVALAVRNASGQVVAKVRQCERAAGRGCCQGLATPW